MKDFAKLILLLLGVICILILLSNEKFKNLISNIKVKDNLKLTKYDEFNLFNFLETKYKNILLPKEIVFVKDGNNYICKNFKFISNFQKKNITITFRPLLDSDFITKYMLFNQYGTFEINQNEENNSEVPEIDHLSSENSDDLQFDINDIINSDIEDNPNKKNVIKDNLNENIPNGEIFLKNIDNNDTENETTETLINNVL